MSIQPAKKSLQKRNSELARPAFQLDVLRRGAGADAGIKPFGDTIAAAGHANFRPTDLQILQINVGKLCNQACAHCHVDAGPDRREVMPRDLLEKCLEIVDRLKIPTVDITGGAPELNPHFRWFVAECAALGARIMNRCNLTIIVSNPAFYDLPDFFAQHRVHVISSLPHFSRLRTDHQRGEGVFEESIRALQRLNAVGYGQPDSDLHLDLVHNPSGAFLPGDQASLELEFKRQLARKFGIVFHRLYAMTNLPISRFLEFLLDSGNYPTYMQLLVEAFNPATIDHLMCRNTLSVSWDGFLHDCDFNQMLELRCAVARPHLNDLDVSALASRTIVTGQHCYGCTAGAGSSCGGELV